MEKRKKIRDISATTMREIRTVAEDWVKKNKKELGALTVETRPVNGHGTLVQLMFVGHLSDKQKNCIRTFIQEGFKAEIKPIVKKKLGWENFRINTCPRDKSLQRYCWHIESRSKSK